MTTLEILLNDPEMAGAWTLAPDRSTITFKVSNMWGLLNVKGHFTDFSGEGQLTGDGGVFGRIDIRAASLDTGIGRRDKHLRSADFFDVERFADIAVVVSAAHPTKGRSADLRAELTIKGVTAPLTLPATISEQEDGSIRVCGETKLERAPFGLGKNMLGMIGANATAAADAVFVRSHG
ncbi:YceI family protein [Mycobacterium sp. Marseille-P9652]|uniref:YceI family protein n=1 Tax=Mycobacterium sp. Marseille-P9652 TaxID=2654950 RepID=UPI0018D1EA64|nr:YceI family protein [Mycobacterium sp. Marseille-P9652]